MSKLDFPQFNRLPFELRDAVWVMFALPRSPMIHLISRKNSSADAYMLCSFGWSDYDYRQRIDLPELSTTRALMQVNQEARKAVLAGRKLQSVNDSQMNVFLGFKYIYERQGYRYEHAIVQKFFFVNWDIDMFYLRCCLFTNIDLFFDKSCLQKIKRIAVDCRGPRRQGNTLYTPGYNKLFGLCSTSHWTFAHPGLTSLNSIYLVLGIYATRRLYAYTQFLNIAESDEDQQSGTDIVEQDEEDESASEEDESASEGDEGASEGDEISSEVESDEDGEADFFNGLFGFTHEGWYKDLLHDLPGDQIGFHHFEPESYFDKPFIYLSRRQASPTRVKISFRDWVQNTISRAKGEVGLSLGRPINIQMVMDQYGGFNSEARGYYDGSTGRKVGVIATRLV
ncbi:hypothetical protein E0Z10_g1280 [Xylaria hypoxylon]|uniref:2EXR domain-containing protein n=1 Tax=Xylaria hypoxylon TaxID=37992 RepID=A0A4Z0YTZ1_9PEZI|nr:hypothetical protein E0Z10_g1280 [Xylaria hypoxylon]